MLWKCDAFIWDKKTKTDGRGQETHLSGILWTPQTSRKYPWLPSSVIHATDKGGARCPAKGY